MLQTYPTARSSSLRPVPECTSDFDLAWLPDLLTWEVKMYTQGILELYAGILNLVALHAAVFLYSRKTGGEHNMSPSSARVKMALEGCRHVLFTPKRIFCLSYLRLTEEGAISSNKKY